MNITTTCRDCHQPLPITLDHPATVHDGCTPKLTRLERLCADYLDAVMFNNTELEHRLETTINDLDQQPPKLLLGALTYASYGWPVFPLMPRTKKPATRNGFKAATTNTDQIREWWERRPDCNIGLATGHHFDVIDIDTPDGIPTLVELHQLDGQVHGYACTANAGVHLYIEPHPDLTNMTRFKPGADYRAKGGYVVAPPSTLGQPGRSWSWIHHPSPLITGRSTDA